MYDENEAVVGVATNDMGVAKDGSKKETFQQGVELRGTSNELVLLLQIPPLKYWIITSEPNCLYAHDARLQMPKITP